MVKKSFIYPKEEIVVKSNATTNSYTHPLISIIFWDRFKKTFNFLQKRLLNSELKKYDRILEIGTSYGFFLPSLCSISDNVVGSDIKSTFDFCMDKTLMDIGNSYENLELTPADARNLEDVFPENFFDVIVSFSVFEHIDPLEPALKSVSHCLKPDGIFICEIPTENSLYRFGRKIAGYSDAHEGYCHSDVKKLFLNYFKLEKSFYSPYNIPIFEIGVYKIK